MSETGGTYTFAVSAAVALGNAAMQWRQMAEHMERERDQAFGDLAAAQARADGLKLVVEEYRAALSEAQPIVIRYRDDHLSEIARGVARRIRDILAAEPEARADELGMASGEDGQ